MTKRISSLSIGDAELKSYDLVCRKRTEQKDQANDNVVLVTEIYSDGFCVMKRTVKGAVMTSRWLNIDVRYPIVFSEIIYLNANGNSQSVGTYHSGNFGSGISTLLYNTNNCVTLESLTKDRINIGCERLYDNSTQAKFDVYFEANGYVDLTSKAVQDFINED